MMVGVHPIYSSVRKKKEEKKVPNPSMIQKVTKNLTVRLIYS